MPSPFFPGYGGDKSTKPQFFPGYYVGDPLARPPKYVGGITPTEFAPDPLINFTNGLERDLDSLFQFDHFLPSYWREQIEADFKRTLNAVGESDSSGTDYQSAMEQGDFNEGVRVQVKVNIDLPEIINDPKKWIENTAKDFGKSIFNGDDFRDWVENRYVWAPLIAGTAADSTTEHDRLGGIAPADAVARAAFYAGKDVRRTTVGTSTIVVTPLQLNLTEFAENVDVGNLNATNKKYRKAIAQNYHKVGESFLGFVEDVDAFGKREGNYLKLQSSILKGVEAEVNRLYALGDIPNTIPDVDENLKFFNARFAVMKDLEDLSGEGGLKGINKTLAINFLEKPSAGNDPITGAKITTPPTPPGQAIYEKLLGTWYEKDVNGKVLNPTDPPKVGFVLRLRNTITSGETGLTTKQLAIYRQQTKGLLDLAESLEKFANNNKNLKAGDPRIGKIMGDLSAISGDISRPGIFRGLQDNYVNRFMEDLAAGRHGFKEIQEYLKAKDPNYLVGMDNSLRVYKIARRYFNSAEAVDIVGHLESGKFVRNYLYNQQLINRVMGYTPAALSTEFLKRVHYFGLSYDPDYDNKKVLWVIPAAKVFKNMPWCWDNKFEISYTVGGVSKSLKFTGTGDFKAAIGLFKAMAKPENANPINNIMTEMLADFWAPHGSAIVDKLAKEKITYASFDKLRKLLATKFGLTSGTPLTATQQEELKNFLLALGHYDGKNYNLSIALAKAGLLQHIAAGASKIQTGFYIFLDKIGIGKVISAYHQFKLAAAELVAQAVTKFFQLLAAAGTFGTSTLIAPLIEALGRFVKIGFLWLWNKIENLLGALLKGDLSGYWKGLEKGMNNLIKVSLYILLVPVILGIFVMFMMGTILSAVPSASPARTDDVSGMAAAISSTASYANCTTSSPMPTVNNSAGSIATKAFGIVSGLERGVWCLWNKSAAYPELWNPPSDYPACNATKNCSNPSANGIFWCTWLVIKSYNDVPSNLLNARSMLDYFKNTRGRGFYSPGTNIKGKIAPGDVIFSQPQPDKGSDGYHVEIIYSVTLDSRGNGSIITVNSNSNDKSHNYSVVSGFVQGLPGLPHAGIGKQ